MHPLWHFNSALRDGNDKSVSLKRKCQHDKFNVIKEQKKKAHELVNKKLTDADPDLIDKWHRKLMEIPKDAEEVMTDDMAVLCTFSHCF